MASPFSRIITDRFPDSSARLAVLALTATMVAGCNTKTSLPPVEPPAARAATEVGNQPPVIQNIAISTTRAEVGQDVAVAAAVSGSTSSLHTMRYEWKANAGTFTGSGPTVTWRLAKGIGNMPLTVAISLEVVDAYQDMDANGLPSPREARVSAKAPPLIVHDSRAELTRMAVAFLVTYFGHSDVSPAACLVDFADSCSGKADELRDIIENRRLFHILSAEAHVDSIVFNPQMDHADITAPCTFHDRLLASGKETITIGNCTMAAVFEKERWWLCDSHLTGSHTVLGDPFSAK